MVSTCTCAADSIGTYGPERDRRGVLSAALGVARASGAEEYVANGHQVLVFPGSDPVPVLCPSPIRAADGGAGHCGAPVVGEDGTTCARHAGDGWDAVWRQAWEQGFAPLV